MRQVIGELALQIARQFLTILDHNFLLRNFNATLSSLMRFVMAIIKASASFLACASLLRSTSAALNLSISILMYLAMKLKY